MTMDMRAGKHIMYAHSVSVLGGAERVTLAMIKSVSESYKVSLLAPEGELQKEAAQLNADVHTLDYFQHSNRHPLKSLHHFYKTYRLLKSIGPDIIHTGDILALRSLNPVCKMLNIPVICHVHFPYSKSFVDWVFTDTTAVNTFIYCSEELKTYLLPVLAGKKPASNQVVVHNGIDIETFKPVDNKNEIPRIGIIANLQERKGHDDFLQMGRILKERGYNVQLDIVGGDILQNPRQPILQKRAEELNIDQCTRFHGQLKDVKPLLNSMDIVVCASHEEAFPVTILESMAAGKAIVSTNVNGIPEAIDETCSILTTPHNPEGLADGVQFLLDNSDEASRLAENARIRVMNNFTSSKFSEKIQNVYNRILN